MYCPKCGQQQLSDDARFCSRCGLPLSDMAAWLFSGGASGLVKAEPASREMTPRRKGIRRGAKLMFFSIVLLPLVIGLSIATENPVPIVLSLMLFFVGAVLALYARLFRDDFVEHAPPPLQRSRHADALPPARADAQTSLHARPANTAEIARPFSVTDHTTTLLPKE